MHRLIWLIFFIPWSLLFFGTWSLLRSATLRDRAEDTPCKETGAADSAKPGGNAVPVPVDATGARTAAPIRVPGGNHGRFVYMRCARSRAKRDKGLAAV